MSHLPLDARAILDYLNELGYRNISGEQLKEFMKGMHSQSESYKSKFKTKSSSHNHSNNSQQQSPRRELQRQQQQRQQQPLQSSTSATTVTKSTTAAAAETTAAAVGGQHSSKSTTSLPPQQQQRRATVKVIKCKKPLCHFKFYLDICDHQLAKRIEEQIRTLGGALEFFLTANVTHFITDKEILSTIAGGAGSNNNSNNNNSLSSRPATPQTPGTPKTPQTPYAAAGSDAAITTQDGKTNVLCNTPTTGTISRKSINTRQTRANAILNRVRRASTTTTPSNVVNSINVNAVGSFVERTTRNSPATPISSRDVKHKQTVVAAATPPIIISTENPYIIWQTEHALHFFKKVQHELKDYLGNTNNNNNTHIRHENKLLHAHKGGGHRSSSTVDAIDLKGGGYLKIESIKRNYRPYYQLFRKSAGTEWPKIELTREDGAFRLSPKKKKQQAVINKEEVFTAKAEAALVEKKEKQEKIVRADNPEEEEEKAVNMTRKSRSRSSQNQRTQPLHSTVKTLKKTSAAAEKLKSSQRNSHAGVGGGAGAGAGAAAVCKQAKDTSDKQCGVCEICKIEYDTLTIHLKTKDHEYFAKNSQNFIALDTLIHSSADVNKFLSEDKKVADLEEMEVENIEVMADENTPDPLEGSDPLVGGAAGGGGAVLPATLIELSEDKRRLAGGAHHTPSPTLREKSKRSTKGKHSSEKFQNIRLSKSPKSTKSAATSPVKQHQQSAPAATATTTAHAHARGNISSSMLELQTIAAKAESAAHVVKTSKTAKSAAPARRKTISASALSPPIRAMLPPSSLYKVVGTPETSVYGTPSRKMRGGEQQSGRGDGNNDVTASPSLIVKFKKVRSAELNRLNGEAESFMFPKQRTSSELPTDVDRQTTSDNARARSVSSTSLDTSTSDGDDDECSMDVEEEAEAEERAVGRGKQQAGKRAYAIAKRSKDSKAKSAATSKQRFPNAPIQPVIQLKDKQQETRRSTTATSVLSKTQQTTIAGASKTTVSATKAGTKVTSSKSVSNVSTDTDSPAAKRTTAAISAAAAKANAAAAALAAITLPEATRKSSRTATAIVTAATTSSRLLRAAVEAAKYNCRQMAASIERLPTVGANGRKMSAANANAVTTKTTKSTSSTGTTTAKTTAASTTTTKSMHKRVPVVKMEDRMGDLKNEKKKKINIRNSKRRSDSDDDEDDDDEDEKYQQASSSKCIKKEKQNAHINKELALKAYHVARGMLDGDDDDDDTDDYDDIDNDDEKDEDYIHCKKSRRKSMLYDNLSAFWESGAQSTSTSALSRKQRAAQREEQKCKMAMMTANDDNEAITAVKAGGGKRKNSYDTPTKSMKLNNTATKTSASKKKICKTETNDDCPPANIITETPTLKPKTNERVKFDLASCARLNEMRYSFERIPVTDLWYRVFMRQDMCTERFYEYYGSTNYRKLPYELGPIPYARTLTKGVCCKLCDNKNNTSATADFVLSSTSTNSKEAKNKRGFSTNTTHKNAAAICKVKSEPIEEYKEAAAASKSRDSSSSKSLDLLVNANNSYATGSNLNTLEPSASTATTTTATTTTQMTISTSNSATSNTTHMYTHKHKKLAFLQRYRQEQQELQKRQAEQQLNNSTQQQIADNSNQCDSNASTSTLQERLPRERKRAGSTHSTTSSTSCASSTATTKTKNRYFNKHLNKAAAAFLNLELPPRKSPREHASTLALVSCIIKQRQDSQSKPNSETDEPPPTPCTPLAGNSGGAAAEGVTEIHATTKGPTEEADGTSKSSNTNIELPTHLRSPRHTRSAAATPVEEMRFTTVISENVKRMRRGQNKYDHSPPIEHTQRLAMPRKPGRGRPPRSYSRLQKFLQATESAAAVTAATSRRTETPSSALMATAGATLGATAAAVSTGDRRRRVKRGPGWTSTMGLMPGGGRRHHSHYTGLLAQGSDLPTVRKTGSKKGVLEFEVDGTALKALDAATQHTNVRLLEWQIDKYLQLYGREYDVDAADDLVLSISECKEMAQEVQPPEVTANSANNTGTNTRKCSTATTTATSTASTSKALRRASSLNVDVKRSACSSTALTQTVAPFDGALNTPPPTDYFSSDFDLYDLFTNAANGEGSRAATDDDETAETSAKRKSTSFSLYSSIAMQNYFRKRKSLKSNRTGWPKAQKKKTSVRQQHILARKIRFLQDIGELSSKGLKQEAAEGCKEGDAVVDGAKEDDEGAAAKRRKVQRRRRENGVITPPESELNNVDACGDEDTEIDAAESIPEEEDEEDDDGEEDEELEDDAETMAETVDEEYEDEAEAEATRTERDADAAVEADEEDLEDAELDCADVRHVDHDDDDLQMDDDSRLHATRKRMHRQRRRGSRASTQEDEEKRLTTNAALTPAAHTTTSNNNNNGATSTPTKQLLRAGSALRRTPQLLNGSLGSCISPSEKAGDNSDIFTVSSDGLDTDLDMSNSQHKCDDEHSQHHHHHNHHHYPMHHDQCAHNQQTPKRKFDLSKYAPNNAASSSCAAEAATAAVKSLAISQFLKKEVRVQCRRLRAPFRRYRYRR